MTPEKTRQIIQLCLAVIFIVPMVVAIHAAYLMELLLIWIASEPDAAIAKANVDRVTNCKNELIKNSYVLKWLKF